MQLNKIQTARTYLDACAETYRGVEWHFLDRFLDQSDRTLQHPSGGTFSDVQLSPDEQFLALCGSDSSIYLYSYPGLELLQRLRGHQGAVSTMDFSADGRRLVSGGRDHAVIVWDLQSGQAVFKNDTAFSQGIYQVRFSPDDRRLGVVSWELRTFSPRVMGFAKILDARDGAVQQKIETEPHPAAGIVFTERGEKVIISCWGEVAACYQRTTGEEIWRYDLSDPQEYNAFHSIALSPDGKTLVLGSTDHRLHLLDAHSGALLQRIEPWQGHTKTIKAVQYTADGRWMASAGEDQSILVWDAAGPNRLFRLVGHTQAVSNLCWSNDGKHLLSVSNDGTLKLWDLSRPFEVSYEVCNYGPWQVPVSADGQYFAAPCSDEHLGIYNIRSGQQLHDMSGYKGLCGDYSKDGRYLVTADFAGVVHLWDGRDGRPIRHYSGHSGRVDGVAILDRSDLIASAGDTTLRIWDPTREEVKRIIAFPAEPFRVVAAPDEDLLYVGFDNGEIRVLRAADWQELHTFFTPAGLNEMQISPDGRYLAVFSGRQISILDADSGHLKHSLEGHEQTGYGIGFSPDSRYLISGSYDQTFKLWDLANGRCTFTFHGYQEVIYSARFLSPQELLIGTAEGRMRYYRF